MILLTNEDRLQAALAAVMQCDHTVMDGEPEEAAVYVYSGEQGIYESDVLLMAYDVFAVRVYQRDFDAERVDACVEAMRDAGFQVARRGAEAMENGYYRYALEARIIREEEDE